MEKQLGLLRIRKGKSKRGGARENAGRTPARTLAKFPEGHAAACVREEIAREQTLREENKSLRTRLGKLESGWDCMVRNTKDAVKNRGSLKKQLEEAQETITELQARSIPVPTPAPYLPPRAAPVPTPESKPTPLRPYSSDSSKKRAVRKLRVFLRLYPADCQVDLVARAIVVDGRAGKNAHLGAGFVKALLAHPRMATNMKQHAEAILKRAREHMMQTALSPDNFVAARRLLRMSYRKLMWLRRLLSHAGKKAHVMHPDYDTCVPVNPSVPAMAAYEKRTFDEMGGVVKQEDRRGAVCEDLDRVLCQTIARAYLAGELVSTGEGNDNHIFMWGGGGFLARKKGKWVQLGVILCSTSSMNQSPQDSQFVMNFAGGEDFDILNIRLEDLRPVLQRLARDGHLLDTRGELPAGVGKGIAFALGGDKPWILTVLGRRNMNHTHFSATCKCTRESISCLDCEGGQEGHYSVDADDMCRTSHVCPNMWIRGGDFVPFVCRCCDKEFSCLEDVEAEEEWVLRQEEGPFKAWSGRYSLLHEGRFWGSGPLLPFKWIWSDPLHLFLNLFNVAFDESIDFFVQHEFVSAESKDLIAQCDTIGRGVNSILAAAHITARFGTDERKAFCGNDLRALMQHTSVLPDIHALVSPLYARMEPLSFAADAHKARADKKKQEERMAKEAEAGSAGKAKKARVDADDFNETAGISKAAATRVRKSQAALKAAAEKVMSFDDRFEAHVAEMQQGVDGNYRWRVVNMLHGLVAFYEFVHEKQWLSDALAADDADAGGWWCAGVIQRGRGPAVTLAVQKRRSDCKERSMLLATDIISAVGTAREQTYLHDLVYGLHRVFDVVLHPLLAGMQGVEHVNKQMKLSLVSQCTAANNNRRDSEGNRMMGDVAQAAQAKVIRTHLEARADNLPSNQYAQMLMGKLGWGSKVHVERTRQYDHKVLSAGATAGLAALLTGDHSPQFRPPAVLSPGTMSERLLNPSRKKRLTVRVPSSLRPDFVEPEPGCAPK